jgi:hypothetical protein
MASALPTLFGSTLNKNLAMGLENLYIFPSIIALSLPPFTAVLPVLTAKAQCPSYANELVEFSISIDF